MENLKILLSELTPYVGLIDVWQEQAKTLERKSKNINIVDFDDTLFSRKEQLKEDIFKENRGEKGNEMIINQMGIIHFVEKYYEKYSFPDDIINTLSPEDDLILTAGVYELQRAKLEGCGITDFNVIIVPSGKDKILETIRYVLYTLSYIPKSITIYEDRPEYFMQFIPLIEGVLQTKLIIKKVVMKDNSGYESIEEIS